MENYAEQYYFVYSESLSKELKKKGFNYIIKAKSIIDNKIFTMFLKSDELLEAVEEYIAKKSNVLTHEGC